MGIAFQPKQAAGGVGAKACPYQALVVEGSGGERQALGLGYQRVEDARVAVSLVHRRISAQEVEVAVHTAGVCESSP